MSDVMKLTNCNSDVDSKSLRKAEVNSAILVEQKGNRDNNVRKDWGENFDMNLIDYLDPALLIQAKDGWIAVVSPNDSDSFTVNNPHSFHKKRGYAAAGRKQNARQHHSSSLKRLVMYGPNGWDGSGKLLISELASRKDQNNVMLKMITSNRCNARNAPLIFPWNAAGGQGGGGLLLVSREQWKALAQSFQSFQNTLLGGAQAWLKKTFRSGRGRTCSSKDMGDSSVPILRKWISIKNISKKKGQTGEMLETASSMETGNRGFHIGKIRIEIKPDWEQRNKDGIISSTEDRLEESLHQYWEGENIKIRVTMFCIPEVDSCSQLEIDLVQSFVCETETDRCRRRIAKVLKRNVVTDFHWEKGVTSSGIYFYIHCNHFEIPRVSPMDLENSLEKFRISNFQHELRLRFICEGDQGQTATSACSFPINIYENGRAECKVDA